MKSNKFYKTSPYSHTGSNVSFHGINGRNYITNIDLAEIYTREEAQKEVDLGHLRESVNEELFLSVDKVDELAVWKVDHQYINLSYPERKDPNDEYVIYRKGVYDGNDLGFSSSQYYSYDYSQARVFTEQQLGEMDLEGWVAVPKFHTDENARRTFQFKNINKRKMIVSAGITGIRKKRKSRDSGKVRWNCPTCGKFIWQYNPYDFHSCNDISCESYVSSSEMICDE